MNSTLKNVGRWTVALLIIAGGLTFLSQGTFYAGLQKNGVPFVGWGLDATQMVREKGQRISPNQPPAPPTKRPSKEIFI